MPSTQDLPAVRAIPQNAPWTQSWWHARHQEKKALAETTRVEVAFLGDSITHGFESEAGKDAWNKFFACRKALNLGFSADRTEHLLWRVKNGALDDAQPKIAVVLIGTNNLSYRWDHPSRVAGGMEVRVK